MNAMIVVCRESNIRAFGELVQNGRGAKRTAQEFSELLGYLAARIRTLCTLSIRLGLVCTSYNSS